jgi:hypothetical protein
MMTPLAACSRHRLHSAERRTAGEGGGRRDRHRDQGRRLRGSRLLLPRPGGTSLERRQLRSLKGARITWSNVPIVRDSALRFDLQAIHLPDVDLPTIVVP